MRRLMRVKLVTELTARPPLLPNGLKIRISKLGGESSAAHPGVVTLGEHVVEQQADADPAIRSLSAVRE